jgi:hypothetical protein
MERQRSRWIDEAQLAAHAEVHDEDEVVDEADEDVLPAASNSGDLHADNRVDESFGFRVPNDGGKPKLAPKKGATNEMRPQISGDRLNLG